jgi:ABC-type transport system substrate-binding protein
MTLEFTIDTSKMDDSFNKFPDVLAKAISMTALDLDGNLYKEAPKVTGRLATSWQARPFSKLVWIINSNVVYRWFVNDGTKPHDIRPKNAKALYFTVKGGMVHASTTGPFSHFSIKDEGVFCRLVHHPGTKANPYVQRAMKLTEARLPEFAEKAVKAVM